MLISKECLLSELVKEGNDANEVYADRREFRAGVAEGLRLASVIACSEYVTPKSEESPADSPASPVQHSQPAIPAPLIEVICKLIELCGPEEQHWMYAKLDQVQQASAQ
jgi:hypothetical protein